MRQLTLRDLEDLGYKRFEALVAALVLTKHPEAEHLGGKDGGADVLLERPGAKPKVWQAKHYPKTIHWAHCVESLDTLVEKHGADEVVFAFPRNMSKPVKKSFREKLQSRYEGVDVSYIAGSQIINELRERDDDLVEEFFGPDPRDQARVLAEQLGSRGLQISRRPGGDEISDRLELADAAGRRDRHFRTEVAATTGDAPIPAWIERPSMVVTQRGSDRTLRIAAWPEKEKDLELLEFRFEDSEDGRRARLEVTEMLASRGEAELPPGASIGLKQVPEAVRALSDATMLDNVVLTSTRSHEVKLAAELDGERIERTMDVVFVPPREGSPRNAETSDFGRLDGALAFFVAFRLSGETLEIDIDLQLHVTDRANLRDALDAARLLVAWNEGTGTMEVPSLAPIGPLSFRGLADEARATNHRNAMRLFENLLVIQDALGVTEFDFAKQITSEEFEAADRAAGVIRSRADHFTFSSFGGEVSAEELDELGEHEDGPSIVRFPVTVTVFGKELELGIAEAELPKPSSIEVLDGSDPSRKTFELRWNEEPSVPFQLIGQPGSPPPPTGIWLPGEAPPIPSFGAELLNKRL